MRRPENTTDPWKLRRWKLCICKPMRPALFSFYSDPGTAHNDT